MGRGAASSCSTRSASSPPSSATRRRRFFDERWIDAPTRPGKRGGAFCAYTTPSVHPYVMLNWTGKRRDVLTLAHELGHGLHAALAIPRGPLEQGTPLTVCETASVFGETLVFKRLLDATDSPESRLALLAENIEGSIATVFRQTAMNGFEDRAHTARREEGELSVERIGELWEASQVDLLGDAVEITDGYRSWWSYVPHFIGTPGYVYAYAYGQLLALSVYRRYEEEGEDFVPRYVELLSAGGSQEPRGAGRDRRPRSRRTRASGPRAWISCASSSTPPRPPPPRCRDDPRDRAAADRRRCHGGRGAGVQACLRRRRRGRQRRRLGAHGRRPFVSVDIAHGKAWTAAAFRVPSAARGDQAKELVAFSSAVSAATHGRYTPQIGALPIDGGGAMGASGAQGHEDEAVVNAAIERVLGS